MEAELIERLLLNVGSSTPWLLVVYMLLRWVWPDVNSLLSEYLKARQSSTTAQEQQLSRLVTDVSTLATTLNGLILGLAGKEARDGLRSLLIPPVSPKGSESTAGEASRDEAATEVQT